MTKIVCLAALLAASGFVYAQSGGGQIAGRVTDPSDAAILDARVTISNIDTGVQRETRSSASGAYALPLLQPGNYRITAQKEGFRPVSRTNVNLQVDQVARVDFQLQLGSISETVEVTAEAPSTNGQFGDVPVNTMDDSIISINGGRTKLSEIRAFGTINSTTGLPRILQISAKLLF